MDDYAHAGKKVFVGGLSWETDEASLRAYFAQFGAVSDCVIMRDRNTGHPRGFGFVTYDLELVADRVAAARHELDGRVVEAKRAVPRSECTPTARTHATRATKKVFVGGLPATCGDAEFQGYFGRFGDVAECQVMYDHQTGNSRGFGFVTFVSEGTVERVVDMDKHDIMGKFVEVKRAEPKQVLEARRGREAARPAPPPQAPFSALLPPAALSPGTAGLYAAFAPSAAAAAFSPPGGSSWTSLGNGVVAPPESFPPAAPPAAPAAPPQDPAAMSFFTPAQPYAPELAQYVHAAFYGAAAASDGFPSPFARPVTSARVERRFHPYATRERIERSYR